MTVRYYGPQTASKTLFNKQLIDNPPSVIGVDTETISLKERLPILFSIATSPNEAWVFDILPERDLETEMLQSIMTDPSIRKVYANVMFDVKVQELIFTDFPVDLTNIADILVWARLLGRTAARVTDLAKEINREVQPAEELLTEYGVKSMLEVPHEAVAHHCATDAMVTLALHNYLEPMVTTIEGLSPDYLDVERKVVPILIDMSQRGLAIDQDARALMQDRLEEDKEYYKGICAEHDFNPGSGMQSGYILAKRGAFLPLTKSKKQYKTDEDTLELLDDPLATVILGYKRVNSILTKYLYPMSKMERLYCLHPNTRVLTTNLEWKAISKISTGDFLIGVKNSEKSNGVYDVMYPAEVLSTSRTVDFAYKITTDRGQTVIANGKHLWLTDESQTYYYKVTKQTKKWTRTDELKVGSKIKCGVLPWDYDCSRDAGYLAGLLDGEGYVATANVGFVQKEGLILDKAKELFKNLGFDYWKNDSVGGNARQIRFSLYESMRLLGSIRPLRLLENADKLWVKKLLMTGRSKLQRLATVISIEPVGECELVDISTDTHTFLAEGLATHNTNYGLDTEVGRTKSSDFNMQNIPAATSRVAIDVRHICYPDTGTFTTGDYSQEHLRILMYMSGDKEMERVYYDGKDEGDIHISTMKKIHKPRSIAKILNYSTPYGGSSQQLATILKTKDLKWCSGLIDDWFEAYPDAAEWIKAARKYGFEHNKSLPTLFGRSIAIPDEYNRWEKLNKDAMERKGVNYPILGSDGEVMKRALIICDAYDLPLAVQVHDSITCDGDIIFPVAELESIAPVPLPFEVKKSERWE